MTLFEAPALRNMVRRGRMRLEAALIAEWDRWPLWAPVALAGGAALYFLLPTPALWRSALLGLAALGLVAFVLGEALGRFLVWGALLAALGLGLAWAQAERVRAPVLPHPVATRLLGHVAAVDDGYGRHRLLVDQGWLSGLAAADQPKIVRISAPVVAEDGLPLAPGDWISARVRLSPPSGPSSPGGYDPRRAAWFKGIGAQGMAVGPVYRVAGVNPTPDFWQAQVATRVEAVRVHLYQRLQAEIGGPPGALAAGLTVGMRADIPEAVVTALRRAGLAHLLSISGLHISAVAGGFFLLSRRLLALSTRVALFWPVKSLSAAIALLAAGSYTLLSGGDSPSVRSFIATAVVLMAIWIGRQALGLRLVAIGAFVILLLKPQAIVSVSFQLSFMAVTALVVLHEAMQARVVADQEARPGRLTRLGRAAGMLALTSLVIEVALIPIGWAQFNRAGLYGIIANLFAIPLTTFVVLPSLLLGLLLDGLGWGSWGYAPAEMSLRGLILWAQWVGGWPGAEVLLPAAPRTAFGFMVAGLLWLGLWQRRWRWGGLIPVAVGLLLAFCAPPMDVMIHPKGQLVAVRLESGRWLFSDLQAARIARRDWLEDAAQHAAATPADSAPSSGLVETVQPGGRLWQLARAGREWRIALLDADAPLADQGRLCAGVQILVSAGVASAACAGVPLRADAAFLAKNGALAVRFLPGEGVRVQAAKGQDQHPWAR